MLSASWIAVIGRQSAIGVFGVPGGDAGIGQGDIEHGEQAGVGSETAALQLGDLLGDLVPLAGRRVGAGAVGPEPGDLGLVGRASLTGGAAERLVLLTASA